MGASAVNGMNGRGHFRRLHDGATTGGIDVEDTHSSVRRRMPTVLKALAYALVVIAIALALLSAPAHAQSGEKNDSVGEDAIDAITQPLSDLNLRSKDIPTILTLAQNQPYDLARLDDCEAVRGGIAQLDDVLGPDANEEPDQEGLINKGFQTGGKVLGGFIPFRGLVRQISGAKAEEARWEAAIYAGVARRSYLKGYLKGLGCETATEASIRSARDVLGLDAAEGVSGD